MPRTQHPQHDEDADGGKTDEARAADHPLERLPAVAQRVANQPDGVEPQGSLFKIPDKKIGDRLRIPVECRTNAVAHRHSKFCECVQFAQRVFGVDHIEIPPANPHVIVAVATVSAQPGAISLTSWRASGTQQCLDGASLIHRSVSFRDLFQRQREIEDLTRIDLAAGD